jgi:hypothetical protein
MPSPRTPDLQDKVTAAAHARLLALSAGACYGSLAAGSEIRRQKERTKQER